MNLTEMEKKIWDRVRLDLSEEPVASTDHIERMTKWCQQLGPYAGADMEILLAGALLHDVGVVINRKEHYRAGRSRAKDVLNEVGFSQEKIDAVLHVLESHSRYGGAPDPETKEAKVGQDADALEYIGAIGIIRAVVRGLNDGSFSGKVKDFPDYLRSLLAKVEDTFHTEKAGEFGRSRLEYMRNFLKRIEKELHMET